MALFNRKTKKRHDIVVRDFQGTDTAGHFQADLIVNGKAREVALFRPPVILDDDGRSLPGVNRDLVASYMVQTTGMLAGVDLGPVEVRWKDRVGRFVTADFHMQTWGQTLTVMAPVHVVSQEVELITKMYQEAICRKARQIHRGHQSYGESNQLLDHATRKLEQLRDAEHPHLSDAEFLFVAGQIAAARVMNALIPLPVGGQEQVVGQRAQVEPGAGRLPAGG